MRVAMFSAKSYYRSSFAEANERHGHDLAFLEPRLTAQTAGLARGFDAVCPFVNDARDGHPQRLRGAEVDVVEPG